MKHTSLLEADELFERLEEPLFIEEGYEVGYFDGVVGVFRMVGLLRLVGVFRLVGLLRLVGVFRLVGLLRLVGLFLEVGLLRLVGLFLEVGLLRLVGLFLEVGLLRLVGLFLEVGLLRLMGLFTHPEGQRDGFFTVNGQAGCGGGATIACPLQPIKQGLLEYIVFY
ncbi:unknown [Singapore grouper iridovirus]|uniref:Uncharacterized protein n=1 Tax=Singapore grouper iridovirus TaxID=262968 RepID=Q5YFP2_9VIRU|nr:hypothetical protein ORF023R [Singapore grouper iridovirus]AAS18038.1 unknown [Singapore grouper iridovirus]WAU86732.1 hypothetical protein ORF023R [Singapore grouper iridovirus]